MTSRRLRKTREDPTAKLARTILPPEQANRGDLRLIDVANHSDDDQRDMARGLTWDSHGKVKTGERKTVRRQSKIDELRIRGLLDDDEAKACEWYHRAHALRYDTLGVTAKYGDGGGGSKKNYDHLPKTRDQEDAWRNFEFAREGISPPIRPMFERIVLHNWPVGKLGILFKLAARQLMHRIEGRVNI